MQFGTPYFALLFLLAIMGFALIALATSRSDRRRQRAMADVPLYSQLTRNLNPRMRRLKRGLYFLAFLLIILAAGRPQFGESKSIVKRGGVDTLFVIDMSLSMLAEDILPNRFQRSKHEIFKHLSAEISDRVGLVIFSGEAFLFCPLTTDLAAVQLFLDELYVGMIEKGGTYIAKGIEVAIRSFVQEESKHKALVLLSDGEMVGKEEKQKALRAAEAARKSGARIFTIGVGTAAGKPIPIRDASGEVTDFTKDPAGNIVLSKLNEPLLKKIAKVSGGDYIPPSISFHKPLARALEGMEKKRFDDRLSMTYIEQYQLFLLLGFLCLLLSLLLPDRVPSHSRSPHKEAESLPPQGGGVPATKQRESPGNGRSPRRGLQRSKGSPQGMGKVPEKECPSHSGAVS